MPIIKKASLKKFFFFFNCVTFSIKCYSTYYLDFDSEHKMLHASNYGLFIVNFFHKLHQLWGILSWKTVIRGNI